MKRIIVVLLGIMLFFSFFDVFSATCTYDESTGSGVIGKNLNDCLNGTNLVSVGDAKIKGGFSDKIIKWVTTIGSVLSLIAVGGIVYGAFELVISSGADETVSKGKNIIKRSIIGFIALLSAGSIIAIVVNVMYSLG